MSFENELRDLVESEIKSRIKTEARHTEWAQKSTKEAIAARDIYYDIVNEVGNMFEIEVPSYYGIKNSDSKKFIKEFKAKTAKIAESPIKRKILIMSFGDDCGHQNIYTVTKKDAEAIDMASATYGVHDDDYDQFMENLADHKLLPLSEIFDHYKIEYDPECKRIWELTNLITYNQVVDYIELKFINNPDVTLDEFADLIYSLCGGGRMSGATTEWLWV